MGASHEYSPVQPEPGEQRQRSSPSPSDCECCLVVCALLILVLAIGIPLGLLLDQVFTLRVASRGLWATECAEPHMYAAVSYRGVALAASGTLTQQICAGPMEGVEHRFVARGARVVVPGSLLDSLAMDMRGGTPEFDVELRGPGPRHLLWLCGPRMVGDVGALEMECHNYY